MLAQPNLEAQQAGKGNLALIISLPLSEKGTVVSLPQKVSSDPTASVDM